MPAVETDENWTMRLAKHDDRAAIGALIEASARGLSREDYTDAQIEAAIDSVFGVDSDLIDDQTYFVVEQNGVLVGCGGWSQRKTLFGGDRYAERVEGWLDPATDFAKIRAFFIHPEFARRGIGRALLDRCEAAARAAGFAGVELMSTLPGLKLYRACGFVETERMELETPTGEMLGLVPMRKHFE
ncbi:MAG: GNAT family N-acetyltransferase [Pyrinomonadaceae bacterium]